MFCMFYMGELVLCVLYGGVSSICSVCSIWGS